AAKGTQHADEVAKLADVSEKYRKSVSEFFKVLFVDPSVAADYATSAGAFFQDMHDILKKASASYDTASHAQFTKVKDDDSRALKLTVMWGLSAIVGGIILTLWLSHSITSPLGQLTRAMSALARADWSSPVPHGERGDELGSMARAVAVLRDHGVE